MSEYGFQTARRFPLHNHAGGLRAWRCDTCSHTIEASISPVECKCGGEYVQAPVTFVVCGRCNVRTSRDDVHHTTQLCNTCAK